MTRTAILLGFLVSWLTAASSAARATEAPTERPHIRAEVTTSTKSQLKELLASDLDITGAHGSTFDVLVTRAELDELIARGIRTRVVNENVYSPDGLRGGGFLPEYLSYTEVVTALNAPVIESDGVSADLQDFLISDTPLPDETAGNDIDGERRIAWLNDALVVLIERELKIIKERRLAEDGATLESLGRTLGISKERVRQIENRALEKLRAALIKGQDGNLSAFF